MLVKFFELAWNIVTQEPKKHDHLRYVHTGLQPARPHEFQI